MIYLNKYPKITILLAVYIVVFFTFSFSQIIIENILSTLSVLGIFISGAMYTYSFTASVGTGAFLILAKLYSPILLAIVGGIGAGIADVSILKFLERFGFSKELDSFSKEGWFVSICNKMPFLTSKTFLNIAGILTLASPLPDEIGVILIERGKSISPRYLFILGVVANAVGIYTITSIFSS
ncbi:MAG: hypothetical protein WCO48_01895 [Candidatus Taylorbacteria bacterium]